MKKSIGTSLTIAGATAIVMGLSGFRAEAAECLAPADPGGGWDFTCRTVGKLLFDLKLVDGPIQVTNMPGGVGAVAFAHVAADRAEQDDLLVAASTVGLTQIAQGKYPADADVMRWVGMLATDVGVIAVDDDSPIQSLDQLLTEMRENPGSRAKRAWTPKRSAAFDGCSSTGVVLPSRR